jgi:hypothetical protein
MEIICLANSLKGNERCVAGINPKIGQWIRPVSQSGEGALDFKTRNIGGKEPQILDVLNIPIQGLGPDYGCQPENRLIANGNWIKAGKISSDKLLIYCENNVPLLHNDERRIPQTFFDIVSKTNWKSLQLVQVSNIQFFTKQWPERVQYLSLFEFNQNRFKIPVTDPQILSKLNQNETISSNCIITVSLTSPYRGYCYKLVAGVIEL